jgi:hypothetical protein
MTVSKRAIVPVGAAILTLLMTCGCSSEQRPQLVAGHPIVHVPSKGLLTVEYDLDVFNPNGFDLTIDDVQSDLTIADTNPVPSQGGSEHVPVPAHAHTPVHVVLGVSPEDIIYPPAGDSPIPFTISGWALARRADATDARASRIDFVVPNGTMSHDDLRALFAAGRPRL